MLVITRPNWNGGGPAAQTSQDMGVWEVEDVTEHQTSVRSGDQW
jgi:hypothetical protein